MKIGQGSERAGALPSRLSLLSDQDIAVANAPKKKATPKPNRLQRKDSLIAIEGGISMPMRYAKCCKAQEWPHEQIVGNINREGSVMIHRDHCRMYANTNPERRIGVSWKQ